MLSHALLTALVCASLGSGPDAMTDTGTVLPETSSSTPATATEVSEGSGDEVAATKPAAVDRPTTIADERSRPRLVLMDLDAAGVDPATVQVLDGMVADALNRRAEAYDLITAADMRQMLEIEVQRQAVGCTDTSCLAEIAGAMGARYVVFGQVGKLEELLVVHLNLFDSHAASSLSRQVLRSEDVRELADGIDPLVQVLLQPLQPDLAMSMTWTRPLFLVGTGAAAVGAIAAVALGGTALWMNDRLGRPAAEVGPVDKERYLNAGPVVLFAAFGGGALALAGGALIGLSLVE